MKLGTRLLYITAIYTSLICLTSLAQSTSNPPPILVYSKTAGYRHDSIPTAIEALQNIADTTRLYDPTFSEDENLFTTEGLTPFKAIVFLSNSDQVLTSEGEQALQEWLGKGTNALVGLHAATACLFEDQAFGVAMGSWFHRHPDIQNATFTKLTSHPTIDMLPSRYTTYEEVYEFRTDPRSVNATVLLTVDPNTYTDDDKPTPEGIDSPYYQGSPHPIAWYREGGMNVDLSNGTDPNGTKMNGRMWHTSLGHTNETWRSELHLQHVEAGLRWALEDFTSSTNTTSASPSATSPTSPSSSDPASTSSTNGATSSTRSIGGGGVLSLLSLFAGFTCCYLV